MATPAAAPDPRAPVPGPPAFGAGLARHRNPLWRRTDSLRWWLRVLLVLGMAAALLVALLIALLQYHATRAETLRHDAELRPVQAVVLSVPVAPPAPLASAGSGPTALVRWNVGSTTREQNVGVPFGTGVGARYRCGWPRTAR
ncbi:hypothetical protein GXW82_18690 [Streptacidiphilus sp. 4-A2]|nr:hypothetical protein [Streptacidiphilus sp. 4-A2]